MSAATSSGSGPSGPRRSRRASIAPGSSGSSRARLPVKSHASWVAVFVGRPSSRCDGAPTSTAGCVSSCSQAYEHASSIVCGSAYARRATRRSSRVHRHGAGRRSSGSDRLGCRWWCRGSRLRSLWRGLPRSRRGAERQEARPRISRTGLSCGRGCSWRSIRYAARRSRADGAPASLVRCSLQAVGWRQRPRRNAAVQQRATLHMAYWNSWRTSGASASVSSWPVIFSRLERPASRAARPPLACRRGHRGRAAWRRSGGGQRRADPARSVRKRDDREVATRQLLGPGAGTPLLRRARHHTVALLAPAAVVQAGRAGLDDDLEAEPRYPPAARRASKIRSARSMLARTSLAESSLTGRGRIS